MKLQAIACITISTTSLLMSACSPVNSEFSCKATASDSCMTIEQVDAMTRYADAGSRHSHSSRHQRKSGTVNPHKSANHTNTKVWLAPRPFK